MDNKKKSELYDKMKRYQIFSYIISMIMIVISVFILIYQENRIVVNILFGVVTVFLIIWLILKVRARKIGESIVIKESEEKLLKK